MMKIPALTVLILALAAGPGLSQQKSKTRIDPTVEAAAMKLLDEYMSAWNNKDIEAWERTFQFPHYRLASGNMSVLERSGMQDATRLWKAMTDTGWHHSKWDHRRIIHA